MDKDFYVGGYWPSRWETPCECAKRTVRFLARIESVSSCFSDWYEYSTRERPATKIALTEENLERLFAAGVNRRDTDHTIIRELGFHLGLQNGPDRSALTISIFCGGYSQQTTNSCVISPTWQVAFPEIVLNVPLLLQVLTAMIDCFEVHHAVVASVELSEKIKFPLGALHVGWLSLFSNSFRKLPSFRPPTRVVPIEGKGNIVILTDERFTSDHPEHLKIAQDVVAALRAANVIPKP